MPPKPSTKAPAPAAKAAAAKPQSAPAKKGPAAPNTKPVQQAKPTTTAKAPVKAPLPSKATPTGKAAVTGKATTTAKAAPGAKATAQTTRNAPAAKDRKEHAGIFIKGIPTTERLEDIKKVFKSAGNIIAARRRGSKYCMLWFDNVAAVRKAIDAFHNKVIHSHKLVVLPAKASPPPSPSDVCKTVYVGGLSHEVKVRTQLRKELSGCGDIIKIRLYRGGHAFVYFKDVKGANKARADFNGKKLLGNTVKVAFSYRTKERDALLHRRGVNRSKVSKALRELRGKVAH